MPRQSSNLPAYFSHAQERTGIPAAEYQRIFEALGIKVVPGDNLGMHFIHPLRDRDRHLTEHALDQRVGAYNTIETNLDARFDSERSGATLDLAESKASVLPDEFLAESAEKAFDKSLRAKDLPLAERCLHEEFYAEDKYWEGAEKVVNAYMKNDQYAEMMRAAKKFGYDDNLELPGLRVKAAKRLLYQGGKPVRLTANRVTRIKRLVAELGDKDINTWIRTYISRAAGSTKRQDQLARERTEHGMVHR